MKMKKSFLRFSFWLSFFADVKKADFIPSLVGPLLLVTLIPQSDVRQLTIPIFLDMIITGLYYKPKPDEIQNGHSKVSVHSKFIEVKKKC